MFENAARCCEQPDRWRETPGSCASDMPGCAMNGPGCVSATEKQPIRIGKRHRPQQHAVDDGEHGDGRADAERQRQDGAAAVKAGDSAAACEPRSGDPAARPRRGGRARVSRHSSLRCSMPPSARSAARRASSGERPRATCSSTGARHGTGAPRPARDPASLPRKSDRSRMGTRVQPAFDGRCGHGSCLLRCERPARSRRTADPSWRFPCSRCRRPGRVSA